MFKRGGFGGLVKGRFQGQGLGVPYRVGLKAIGAMANRIRVGITNYNFIHVFCNKKEAKGVYSEHQPSSLYVNPTLAYNCI